MSERNHVKWVVWGIGALAILGLAGWIGFALISGSFWSSGMPDASGLEAPTSTQTLQFPNHWQPPSREASAERLFPAQVAIWTHLGHDANTQIPELNLDREGHHGRYESGAIHVDVYAFTVSAFEATEVFDRVHTVLLRTGAVHYPPAPSRNRGLGSRLPSPPRPITMWWSQGWLFVFISDDPELDLESFHIPYLLAIEGRDATTGETSAHGP